MPERNCLHIYYTMCEVRMEQPAAQFCSQMKLKYNPRSETNAWNAFRLSLLHANILHTNHKQSWIHFRRNCGGYVDLNACAFNAFQLVDKLICNRSFPSFSNWNIFEEYKFGITENNDNNNYYYWNQILNEMIELRTMCRLCEIAWN